MGLKFQINQPRPEAPRRKQGIKPDFRARYFLLSFLPVQWGMDESTLIRLDLRASLVFDKMPGLEPFPAEGDGSERLFCFGLDPAQARSIEPDREQLLGGLLFAGRAEKENAENTAGGKAGAVRLPAGIYLFAQWRDAPDRDTCLEMAIEQQKDGLWERHELEPTLYVRCLFEDGKPVTQIFRPCKG
jgi:hypothetical protein